MPVALSCWRKALGWVWGALLTRVKPPLQGLCHSQKGDGYRCPDHGTFPGSCVWMMSHWGGGRPPVNRKWGGVGGRRRGEKNSKTLPTHSVSLPPCPLPASRTYTTTPQQMGWGFPVWALSLCLQGKAWVCFNLISFLNVKKNPIF